MGGAFRLDRTRRFAGLRAGVAAAALLACGLSLLPALHAQPVTDADGNLLLTSELLTYNFDSERIIASGDVRIDYDGYRMVAERVEYDQRTGRLYAVGDIELIEPDGNRIYAQELDITDDFRDGFVNALRIETPANTRIVGQSAERRGGTETILNNGVYTACQLCSADPEKPPLWQIKAQRVIRDGENRTIRLEGASFELFGRPIAYVPYLVVPDYDRQRKSGLLSPSISYDSDLGLGVRVPYYFVLSPHMDATVAMTGYTQQGFLAEGEFRRRFNNGDIAIRGAGIRQLDREAFDARTADWSQEWRGLVNTTGHFVINPRWSYGWDLTIQSDNNFGATYNIEYYNDDTEVSEAYLTGLNDRNYFDLRGYAFDEQTPRLDDQVATTQPIVHPIFDYGYILDRPLGGGELSFDVNAASLSRDEEDFVNFVGTDRDRLRGVEGFTNRVSGEMEWRRRFTTPAGLVLVPIAAARGDVHVNDIDETSALTAGVDPEDDMAARVMATAGLEARYPLLVTAEGGTSQHIIEPIGQIFVRPDEQMAGGLPNEDAQSFVFDATTLFDRDKFSGYDRIEGGTRANVGLRYQGDFGNGYAVSAVAGQSYHIAGLNSFATDDFANAGANSGLESDRSDYVANVGLDMPSNFGFHAGTRLDNDSLDINRMNIGADYSAYSYNLSGGLTYQRGQPQYNYAEDRYELRGAALVLFDDNWSAFGAASFDARERVFTNAAIGLGYDDECFSFRLAYSEERDRRAASGRDWSIGAKLTFRTLGELGSGGAAERW